MRQSTFLTDPLLEALELLTVSSALLPQHKYQELWPQQAYCTLLSWFEFNTSLISASHSATAAVGRQLCLSSFAFCIQPLTPDTSSLALGAGGSTRSFPIKPLCNTRQQSGGHLRNVDIFTFLENIWKLLCCHAEVKAQRRRWPRAAARGEGLGCVRGCGSFGSSPGSRGSSSRPRGEGRAHEHAARSRGGTRKDGSFSLALRTTGWLRQEEIN